MGRYEIEGHRFAQPVEELSAEMEGRWLVFSQGSAHLWDLDGMTYARLPGPESVGSFPCDGEPMRVTRVDRWPAVGATSLAECLASPSLEIRGNRNSATLVNVSFDGGTPDSVYLDGNDEVYYFEGYGFGP